MNAGRYPRPGWPRPRLRDEPFSLVEIFDLLIAASEAEEVTLDRLFAAFGQRGLGVLLLLPCLLILTPISQLPLFPAACALAMIFIAGHMFFDVRRLWLPGFIARRMLPGAGLRRALVAARPLASRLDGWMEARLARFAESRLAAASVAVVTIAFGVIIIAIGVVPGLPAALALPVLVLALGLSFRNGILILAGHAFALAMLALPAWILS